MSALGALADVVSTPAAATVIAGLVAAGVGIYVARGGWKIARRTQAAQDRQQTAVAKLTIDEQDRARVSETLWRYIATIEADNARLRARVAELEAKEQAP